MTVIEKELFKLVVEFICSDCNVIHSESIHLVVIIDIGLL